MVNMDGMETKVDLNILPLGSYDLLIGMDWLEKHSTIVNCRDKTFNCLDDFGKSRTSKRNTTGSVSKTNLFFTIKNKCKERL
jgi:hypothetical protein